MAAEGIARRQDRYRRFYASTQPGALLVLLSYPDGAATAPVDFCTFDFSDPREHERYWDRLLDNVLLHSAARADLDDDWMPGVEPYYGFGAFGAVYCDAPLTFVPDTCYIDPALNRLEDMDQLALTGPHFWAQRFIEAARYLCERAAGRCLVNAFPNPSPMDVANLLCGNLIFTAFYEQPDLFKLFLARCRDAAIAHQRAVAAVTYNPGGGAPAFGRWIPQGLLLLEDAADLISPRLYAEFGQPYTQAMIDAAGGGAYLHHHSLGTQQYAHMAALRGLYVEQISSDPGCTRPVTEVSAIYQRIGVTPEHAGLAIDLECTPDELVQHIDALAQGKAILSVSAASKAEARELLAFVRAHSHIR
jgi:hypothetical protein